MNGTEKQIKWATDIKANSGMTELVEKLNATCKPIATEILNNKDAGWWITHRETITGHYQELWGLIEDEVKAEMNK